MPQRNILLLEPGYKNKYPPLGLMKLAQYHKQQGHNVVFAKGIDDPKLEDHKWNRVYITTLFSFEWKRTAASIDKAMELVDGKKSRIFVGGISASLMTDAYKEVPEWSRIRFIQGILKDSPAISLQLNKRDFGHEDTTSIPIDELVPDYKILNDIEYEYPVHDAYFGYSSRGCIRKCAFCGVPKLEGAQRDMPPVSKLVEGVSKLYGEKKDLVLMDNNVTAAPKFNEIIAEIRDLGFTPGARLKRDNRHFKRRVDFNQGVDSRLLAKNPNLLKQLSTICISPLRIAFDHLGVLKPYDRSIRDAAQHGITSLSNYMLYNFFDTPEDLYKRLVHNIELNQELGIRIWSFPMRYQPINFKDRSFIGTKWNKYYLRSFQIILHATHGVVSGSPTFFNMAYGGSVDEFMRLLIMPHAMIFNRKFYFQEAGRPVVDEFFANYDALSDTQKEELIAILSEDVIPNIPTIQRYRNAIQDTTIDSRVRDILRFYVAYGASQKITPDKAFAHYNIEVPEEEKVEDAGLTDYEWLVPDQQYYRAS